MNLNGSGKSARADNKTNIPAAFQINMSRKHEINNAGLFGKY